MNGASTNPDFHVLAHGGAQVKAALDATIELKVVRTMCSGVVAKAT